MDKFTLRADETALMIIDIQERLVPAMQNGEEVVSKAKILIASAVKLGIPIIVTEQYPKGLGKTVELLSQELGETASLRHEKITFSACGAEVSSSLEKSGRKKVIVAGMETHVCVFQTVRDLLAHGYQVFVARDAAASRTKDNHLNGLSLMSSMGAVISNTETILFDLLKEAGTPVFKELSKLVK